MWRMVDSPGHFLRLPRWLMRPICDHYELALGVPRDILVKIDYGGTAPWWLRR